MQPETRFKNNLRKKLDQIPGSWWVKVAQKSLRGTPDFLGCINGQLIALELKRDDIKEDKLQERTLYNIKKAGGYTAVVFPDNAEGILTDLRTIATSPKYAGTTIHHFHTSAAVPVGEKRDRRKRNSGIKSQ